MIEDTIAIPRYADVEIQFVPAATQTVTDITGWNITVVIASLGSHTALITKTATITDAALGKYKAPIAVADTQPLAPGTYWASARRTDSGARDVLSKLTINLYDDAGAP